MRPTALLPHILNTLSIIHAAQIDGCQYATQTWSSYLYFTHPAEPNFSFSIRTPWTTFYPKELEAALLLSNFDWGLAPRTNSKAMCGWTTYKSVSDELFPHGDISYQRRPQRHSSITARAPLDNPPRINAHQKVLANASFASLASAETSFGNVSSADTSAHSPSRTNTDILPSSSQSTSTPNPSTLAHIEAILLTNRPLRDLLLLWAEIMTPLVLFWAACSLSIWLCSRLASQEPEPELSGEERDVELADMKGGPGEEAKEREARVGELPSYTSEYLRGSGFH